MSGELAGLAQTAFSYLNLIHLCIVLGQSFLNFSFYRPSRPNFLKIKKKDIFSIIFCYFTPTHASTQYSTGVQLCFFFFLSFLLQTS